MARPVRRVWVQHVAVGVRVLETRLEVAEATGLGPDQQAAADGVRRLLAEAEDAAHGKGFDGGRLGNWWSGALASSAYQHLHAARSQMVDVFDDDEMAAEIPIAVARSQMSLHRDDPRRLEGFSFDNRTPTQQRALLRRAIKDGYDATDRQHDRLRSFRNIILLLSLFITVLTATTIIVVSATPTILPLCFPADGVADSGDPLLNCPTGSDVLAPSSGDILVVSLLGLLGGALAAAVTLRGLRGTSTPYDLPVALATLKVPLGAFTAFLGLVAIKGDFVPGLSALDSQEQILAYALLLGFAQQVFTMSLDKKAQTLLNNVPSKDASTAPVHGPTPRPPAPERPIREPGRHASRVPDQRPGEPVTADGGLNGSAPSTNGTAPPPFVTDSSMIDLSSSTPAEPAYQPPPIDIDEDVPQDDGSPTLPGVPVGDHR